MAAGPTPATPTPATVLGAAVARLAAAGVADPAGDARRLVAHAMDLPRDRLTLALHDTLTAAQVERFEALIDARANRHPVSHLTGMRAFWGRQFIVTRDTLDPRPETETLIATALAGPFGNVLDLGSGTGAILLTLLAERPQANGMGTDVSEAALAVAVRNAEALGLTDRARFVRSDWWAGVTGRFDLVVSNPPYIAAGEMADLSPEVRDHEPHLALTDGGDGLGAYRAILARAGEHLAPDGRLLLEIGPTQGLAVVALATEAGFGRIRVLPDLDGRDRVVELRPN